MKTPLLIVLALTLCGCTQNQRARSFGGTATIELDSSRKLVNVTFKQDNIWILTRQAKDGETPENYLFEEDSSFGLVEGKVIIKEKLLLNNMTKVIKIGEVPKGEEKKKIVFDKFLSNDLQNIKEGYIKPHDCQFIELISQNYKNSGKDLMFAYSDPQNRSLGYFYIGEFNDGAV